MHSKGNEMSSFEDEKLKGEGFNDQELADIMDEIESLESDDVIEEAPLSSESEEVFENDATIMKQLAEVNIDDNEKDEKVSVLPNTQNGAAPCKMHFNLEGQAKIDMGFQVNGENISLKVESNYITISLSNGSEFRVPLTGEKYKKVS